MSRPQVKEFNSATGEEIIREMTDDEFEQYEIEIAKFAAKEAAAAEAAAKRQALLDKLGITEDEARLLLGGN
jgi:hypothetical protein